MGSCLAHSRSKGYVEDQMQKIRSLHLIMPRTQIRNVLYLHFMQEPVNLLMNFETLQKEYPHIQSREEWLTEQKFGCNSC